MLARLPTATLGRTGLEVTRLGYGAMELRGEPRGRPVADDLAECVLNTILDSGINYIDTSNDYGHSEELIGRFVSHRRPEYGLATKCGCPPAGGREHVWTRENLFRGLEESLGRLRTDYLDVMQLHNPTPEDCEKGGLVQALEDMRVQGKVRWIGISTTVPHLPTFLEWGVFDVFQIPYSAMQREHENWISKAAGAGIGTVIRGGVAKGEPGVSGSNRPDFWERFKETKLEEIREEGESNTAFMLRFALAHPDLHTTIVGTQNPEHLTENAQAALRGPLSADVYAEAKRRLATAGLRP